MTKNIHFVSMTIVLLAGPMVVFFTAMTILKNTKRRAKLREEQLKQIIERRFRSVLMFSGKPRLA